MIKLIRFYSWPLWFAVILHVFLLGLFLIHLPAKNYRSTTNIGPTVVHANAVSEKSVSKAMHMITQRERAKRLAQAQQLALLRHQARLAQAKRQVEARRLVSMRAAQHQLVLKNLREKQALKALKIRREKLHAKLIAERKTAKKAAKVRSVEKVKAIATLKAKQQALEKQMLAKQLAGDSQQLQQLQTQQLQGVINKYRALILSAIGDKWLVPAGANKSLSCVYHISLAPGGVVMSAVLVKSSGNDALDQSAKTAIYKASPLPVPQDSHAFDKFRELRLTVSPKSILHS